MAVAVALSHLSKAFGPTNALTDLSLSFERGKVHAIVGENGSGKSTMIKLLSGVYHPDSGTIRFPDHLYQRLSVEESRAEGVAVIHQDRTLVPTLSVRENLFLGVPVPHSFGRMNVGEMDRQATEAMESIGVSLNLSVPVSRLSPIDQTLVLLTRMQMQRARIVILDEVTAALTDRETDILFGMIRAMRKNGVAILYVSHRLEELPVIADTVSVLRSGRLVATLANEEATKDRLISLMSDSQDVHVLEHAESQIGEVALSVSHLSVPGSRVKDVSLQVRHGEILGLFGLAGSGRSELLEAIYGARPICGGEIQLQGKRMGKHSPQESIRRGMALICEDRKVKGMFPRMSLTANVIMTSLRAFARPRGLDLHRAERDVTTLLDSLSVVCEGPWEKMWKLSGGNQQKVIVCRALLQGARVWLCDEPTIAIDVVTRRQIHQVLRSRSLDGDAILMVSSDVRELLEGCDRIAVLSQGRIMDVLENDHLCAQDVLSVCYQGERTE
ncbi:MAG: sugar ABC transporter ATP-binding protein [Sphaerochaeta sp.]|jgi:ABC-type sugar transport system ATPase subunit|nr:sugar ABC transporter ATP-binding protein [Sphaerochaeta sp.]MCH3920944.1 sugar ABC transporter ATP-binding protein [Sphaerochaeta sp.]MCI2075832.1 sugar ABC transporter ATP-binding protein [Sphaerochaeta sp.]